MATRQVDPDEIYSLKRELIAAHATIQTLKLWRIGLLACLLAMMAAKLLAAGGAV